MTKADLIDLRQQADLAEFYDRYRGIRSLPQDVQLAEYLSLRDFWIDYVGGDVEQSKINEYGVISGVREDFDGPQITVSVETFNTEIGVYFAGSYITARAGYIKGISIFSTLLAPTESKAIDYSMLEILNKLRSETAHIRNGLQRLRQETRQLKLLD